MPVALFERLLKRSVERNLAAIVYLLHVRMPHLTVPAVLRFTPPVCAPHQHDRAAMQAIHVGYSTSRRYIRMSAMQSLICVIDKNELFPSTTCLFPFFSLSLLYTTP
jgi:hypothetical protein